MVSRQERTYLNKKWGIIELKPNKTKGYIPIRKPFMISVNKDDVYKEKTRRIPDTLEFEDKFYCYLVGYICTGTHATKIAEAFVRGNVVKEKRKRNWGNLEEFIEYTIPIQLYKKDQNYRREDDSSLAESSKK